MSEREVRALAMRRWERDRLISQGGDRDLAGIAARGEWDDHDSLCQTYLREARNDLCGAEQSEQP